MNPNNNGTQPPTEEPESRQSLINKLEGRPRATDEVHVHHHHHQAPQMRPVVIEKTAKQWKGLQLFGVLLLVVGLVAARWGPLDLPTGKQDIFDLLTFAFLILGGLIIVFGTFMAWWHHG